MDFHDVFDVLKAELILKYDNMHQFHQYFSQEELLEKIEAVIFNVVESVALGKPPSLQAISRLSLSDSPEQNSKDKTCSINFSRTTSRTKFTSVVFLLSKIHSLLTTNQNSTRRELYYENASFFSCQGEVDRNMKAVSYLLDTPQWGLRVMATSKGIVAGPVLFTMSDGSSVSCDRRGGISIPQNVLEINVITSKAKWVLIIEKDAAFQKLLDSDGLSLLGPVIFITAKGYPDVNTRLLVHKLWDALQIPILCLVDADPHGIEIMCVYRFGSMAMSLFSEDLACPFIRWLGIHPSDILSLKIDSQKLTSHDIKKISLLLNRPYIQQNAELKIQIEILCKEGVKAEIEGVSQISQSYIINDYLPSKILGREFF